MTRASQPRLRRRMFWRFYLSGLALILAVAVSTGVIIHHTRREPQFTAVAGRIFRHLFRPLPAGLDEVGAPAERGWNRYGLPGRGRHRGLEGPRRGRAPDPEIIQARLDEVREVLGGEMAVYTRDGTRLASFGDDPPSPLEAAAARSLRRWDFEVGSDALVAVPISRGPDSPYLRWRIPDVHRPPQPLIFLAVGLVITALIFYPVARSLSRPIERVAATARALGEGDLDARTGVVRKDEIGVLARSVDEAAERIARLLRSEKEMLANVSHELRTPLARLKIALELLDEDGSVDNLRAQLEGMGSDIEELDRLVGDILMAARLELSRDGRGEAGFVLRREPSTSAGLLEDAAARFAARHPDVALHVVPPATPASLLVDRALVRRVLANLLDNAVKYADPARPTEVEIETFVTGGDLRIEVRDRGLGVSEDELPRLFEAFFRSDRSHSKKKPGTGLGLTLCKRIVEAHDGRIGAELRDGGGLTVFFTLPTEA